jgi:hypothetical protein
MLRGEEPLVYDLNILKEVIPSFWYCYNFTDRGTRFEKAKTILSDTKLMSKMLHGPHTPSDGGTSTRQADLPSLRMRRPPVLWECVTYQSHRG